MDKISIDQKPQNIFLIADHLQNTYKNFVKTFQTFQNSEIQNWVNRQMEKEDLLYKDPLIELNFQFEKGKTLQKFAQEQIIDPKIPEIFNIDPYKHQSEAIEKVCKDTNNIIVSTGTGSGKSICFWVPIVNTCLKMKEQGLDGIKAIVIFPMNALANSQYHIIVELLRDTGLKVGRYTGDTAYSEEEAERLLEKNKNRKKYDSELLSREKIRANPPDILITNYVMLDLILTRFEDRELFPEKYKGYLKYLVLDEIHTYSGNSGADVACLMRRLKEKTKTQNKILCIGTSATIQDNKKSGGTASIIELAEKIFGETFNSASLVEASYINLDIPEDKILSLPEIINIDDSDLKNFDGMINSALPIAEKLLGRHLEQNERTAKGLGNLFHYHPTIIFIRNSLKEKAKALRVLAQEYKEKFRKQETIENCLKEIQASFLLGTLAVITVQNEERPLLVPKLHIFFTQGQEINSCLTREGPHLNITGELKCKECEKPSFPLYFCRKCGQEFYSVIITEEGDVRPRTFNMEAEGELLYLAPKNAKNNSWVTPNNWFDKRGKLRKTYEDVLPKNADYCPNCNKIDSPCSCSEKIQVWKIPYPLQLCPSCSIFFTKKKGEFGKLFSFNSTGRSSSTDVLTLGIIKNLSNEQKKQIIFTDNRQDTALQAAHMNEFQRRTTFRRAFLNTLKYIDEKNLRVSDIEIGHIIFQYLKENNILPNYQKKDKEEDEFSSAPLPEKEYKEFLTFLSLSDIMQSNYFLDLSLEKLGILKIEYDGLEKLSNHNYITDIPILEKISIEERYDYLRGILDIFRWNGAISNSAFIDTVNKYEDWEKKLNEDIIFDINKTHYNRVGFALETPERNRKLHLNRQRVVFKSISWYTTTLINWTKKFFPLFSDSYEKADEFLRKIIEVLEKAKFIDIFWTVRPSFKLYQIKEGKILFNLNRNKNFLQCPKCHRTYYFKKFRSCAWRDCPSLEMKNIDSDHYYMNLYQQIPDKESEVHAKEHSAQVPGEKREKYENDFQDSSLGTTNVLVCTPTMELGIDIGSLSAIMMRNVPPDPSRYAQRAGRAGRKNQPSIVQVFCGTGIAKGPHDQYFYNEPEKIVSGKIIPPNFLLENKKLMKKHIHSAIIETLAIKVPQKIREILNLERIEQNYPMFENFKTVVNDEIINNLQFLRNTIKSIFRNEIGKFPWFTKGFINSTISNFISDIDEIFNKFRDNFNETLNEMNYLHQKTIRQRLDTKEMREYNALRRKLNDMREGKRPYNTFGFLKNFGFLPNYAFPSDNSLLTMYNPNAKEEENFHDNWRSSVIAIREFAPHNQVYFSGNKYKINKALVESERGDVDVNRIYICESCNEIIVDSLTSTSTSLAKCPNCEEDIKLSKFKKSIKFPHMYAVSGARITCDEENRQIRGYELTVNYKRKPSALLFFEITVDGSKFGTITYENSGEIYNVNKGYQVKSKSSNEIRLQNFNFCSACGQWLYEGEAEEHIENCSRNGQQRHLYKDLWMFIKGEYDVISFNFPIIGELDINQYYITLKEAIIQSLLLTYNLDESELKGFINPIPGLEEQSIIIFETETGGTGVLKSLLDISTFNFDRFIENMFRILHLKLDEPYDETMDACVVACYNCLLRFKNQYEHKHLNRKLIIPLVKELRKSDISKISKTKPKNPLEQLEELTQLCDSELEKKVLRTIFNLKITLPDEAQKTYYENDNPIVKADFFYNDGIYIFVDGPPHANENVQREDKQKRDIVESNGFTVIDLDFKDGKYTEDPSLVEKEVLKLKDYIEEFVFTFEEDDDGEIVESQNEIKSKALNLLSEFELKMRKFLEDQLKGHYGEDWWNEGTPTKLREDAEGRKRRKETFEPRRVYDIIDFLNLMDYCSIMTTKKNWNNIFIQIFKNKYIIQAPFENLSNIRNDLAHIRFLEEDFERCKTYIEDLLKYLPD